MLVVAGLLIGVLLELLILSTLFGIPRTSDESTREGILIPAWSQGPCTARQYEDTTLVVKCGDLSFLVEMEETND